MLYRSSTVRALQREALQRELRLMAMIEDLQKRLLHVIDKPFPDDYGPPLTPTPLKAVDETFVLTPYDED